MALEAVGGGGVVVQVIARGQWPGWLAPVRAHPGRL